MRFSDSVQQEFVRHSDSLEPALETGRNEPNTPPTTGQTTHLAWARRFRAPLRGCFAVTAPQSDPAGGTNRRRLPRKLRTVKPARRIAYKCDQQGYGGGVDCVRKARQPNRAARHDHRQRGIGSGTPGEVSGLCNVRLGNETYSSRAGCHEDLLYDVGVGRWAGRQADGDGAHRRQRDTCCKEAESGETMSGVGCTTRLCTKQSQPVGRLCVVRSGPWPSRCRLARSRRPQ